MVRAVWDALNKVNRLQAPHKEEVSSNDLAELNLVKVKRDELDALRYAVLKVRSLNPYAWVGCGV